jgi:hypothetical protein
VKHLTFLALTLVAALASPRTFAIDRIVLEVDEISVPGTHMAGATMTLDLTRGRPVARGRVMHLEVPQPIGPLRNVQIECTDVYVREPKIACREGKLTADGGPTRKIAFDV